MQHSLAKGHAHSFLIFSKCDKPLNIEGSLDICRYLYYHCIQSAVKMHFHSQRS